MSTEAEVDSACDRLKLMSFATTIAAMLIAAVFGPLLGIRWSAAGSLGAADSIALLFLAGVLLRRLGGAKRLGTFGEGMAVMFLGTIAAAAVAMVALRTGAPMADSALEAADAALGLHAQLVVAWIATWHVSLDPLRTVYNSAFPEVALSLLLLSAFGRRIEAWRLIFLFVVTLLSCALISFVVPAYGSFVYAVPATIKALPAGAGVFWWDGLNQCRSAAIAVIGVNDLGGVIAFPSFHTIIGLLTMQAWFWNRWIRVPVILWNIAMLFTTLPIGGHYFVDLIAGAVVWLGWSVIAERVVKGFDPFPRHHTALAA